ncbi:MAG TPA: PAS domain-containing protein, partial [Fibrella sp.]
LAGQGFDHLLREVMATGNPYMADEVAVDLVREDQLETIYVNLAYQPMHEGDGTVSGVLVVATDVTQQVLSRRHVETSETKLRGIIAAAPAGIGLFVGRDLIIESPNQTFIDIMGKGPGVEGLPLREAMPELLTEGQPFLNILNEVYTTGIPFSSPASLVKIVQNGVLRDKYYNISYTPVYNAAGEVYAILDIAIDVTTQVAAQQQLKASEARLRSIVEQSPMAIGVLKGRELVIEVGNQRIFDVWGKDASITGMKLIQALPEIEGQGFIELLEGVYESGEPCFGNGVLAKLLRGGKLEEVYFDFVYTPIRDASERINGIMVLATEVTQQVLARQKIEEAEATLRHAVELAKLGTWKLNVATGEVTYSPRLQRWLGLKDAVLDEGRCPRVHPKDRDRISLAIDQALDPDGSGRYEEIYTILNASTGQERIIHASGQTVFDATGVAVSLSCTAQDVTSQQMVQLALEQEVQQRTEELAAANEELAASNEELQASYEEATLFNGQITEANHLLSRSNESLQQFAYIASHDLQEPLRKIQTFGALLETEYGSQLGEGVDYLKRMQASAGRLSALVQDLLTFSRIATQRDIDQPTYLHEVVSLVLTDLELPIRESGATIKVGYLPTVKGNARQLGQLFQNLLSNAIKFRQSTIAPAIEIRSTQIAKINLPEEVTPTRLARSYHRIDVVDNGIGFEQHYVDRIFQVFQRLHGRQQYSGTGIGLAICQKVVNNHGGAIVASSQPDQGATFSVYLPIEN